MIVMAICYYLFMLDTVLISILSLQDNTIIILSVTDKETEAYRYIIFPQSHS